MEPQVRGTRTRQFSTVAVGVALVLLIGLSAWGAGRFADDDGNVHEGNIEAVAAEGITRGCNPPENTLYCPTDPVTRGQMAAFLRRAFNLPESVQDWFIDDDASIFEGDINALAEAGITRGCNPPRNNQFCPDGLVTRGQMAAFLRRAFNLEPSSSDLFVDDDGSVFEADINSIAAAGITKGCNPPVNNRYCPDDLVLRDQMASFLARALGLTPITPPDPCADVPASAIFVSSSGGDGNDGTCDSPVRTIQRGIDIAPVGGLVVVDSGTYNEIVEVPKNLTLEGLGSGLSVIDGAVGSDGDPVLTFRLGINATISGFTVRNGPGGGVSSAATLTLDDVEIIGNGAAESCTAGGIANLEGGVMTARNIEVISNECGSPGAGGPWGAGGVWNGGQLTIEDALLRGNSSDFDGGGLVNDGSATILSSTISFNQASVNSGGGVTNRGDLLIRNSVISDNVVIYEQGGGLLNDAGQATLENVQVLRNTSGLEGGGVATRRDSVGVVLQNVLIADNEAGGNADYNQESGGGITHQVGAMAIESSAIVNNEAMARNPENCCGGRGGGIYIFAELSLTNVTISGNASNVEGGGIAIWFGGEAVATNVTIANNSSPMGGGIMVRGSADITNVLLAGAMSGLNCVVDTTGAGDGVLSSLGHNLDADGSCDLDGVGDQSGVDPKLGPLSDNGGITPTHALLPDSPAIDAGDDIAAPALDQRGIARPQGAASDVGAYERVP